MEREASPLAVKKTKQFKMHCIELVDSFFSAIHLTMKYSIEENCSEIFSLFNLDMKLFETERGITVKIRKYC